MLVQEFLHKYNGRFDLLTEYYGIKVNKNPDDERVILNYCQIESYPHKESDIVRECRGLVVSSNYPYNVIARAFTRFFNKGESKFSDSLFEWSDFVCQEKLDGSLILLYYWNGSWHVNTRNSFGGGQVGESEYTWRDLVFSALPCDLESLDEDLTYIFELCSPYNTVVKLHDETKLFLLSAFKHSREVSYEELELIAQLYGFDLPRVYPLYSQEELTSLIKKIEKESSTNEGIVLRDIFDNRLKVKTESYLRLHRLFSNGNIRSHKNLIPIVMNNESDEVLAYWPNLKEDIDEVSSMLDKYRQELDNYWFVHHDEISRKKFALAVKDCKFAFILFKARDTGVHPIDIFNESVDEVTRRLT